MVRVVFLAFVAVAWTQVSAAAESSDAPCAQQIFEGSRFTVCAFDAGRHELRLAWADPSGRPYRSFAAYKRGRDVARVRFGMNAGMYDEAGAPVGLLTLNGRDVRPLQTGEGGGNFFMKPNGVFFVFDGGVGVATTDAFQKRQAPVLFATQSGPMLVIGGQLHPTFQPDGPSRYVRNGVGVRDAQHALFAIGEEPVSFGKFARFFRDGLGCADALYFDGTVSSLWVPSQGREDAAYRFGPMVIVSDR